MGKSIGHMIEWSAQNFPSKIAFVYEYQSQKHTLTFKEADEKINQFAHSLRALGVQKGDVVSSFMYNSIPFVITLFASSKIGAIFNPINYRLTAHELQYILNDAKAKVLLYDQQGEETVAKVRELGVEVEQYIYTDYPVLPDSLAFDQLLDGESTLEIEINEHDPYIIMYTSGTTGKPKGVIHNHASISHHNFLMMQALGLTKNDVGLSVAPLNHTAELHTAFLPRVQVGATTIIQHHFNSTSVLEAIEKYQISHIFAAPTMVNMLLHHDKFSTYELSSLRLLSYGGASMPPVLVHRCKQLLKADLVQLYGTSEMGPVMSVLYNDDQVSKAGSAGKAILTHEIRIASLGDDEQPAHPDDFCQPGEVGEIIVRGPSTMIGYFNQPESTKKALAYGWYHTGDLAEYDDEGYIWIRDRRNHMIVCGAENIYPREVEDRLVEHPDILEAAVIGKPDEKWGQTVFAFIVKKENSTLTEQEIDSFLLDQGRLAPYKRPRAYRFIAEIPKTSSGKPQKFVLEDAVKNEVEI